jgi:predicted AAA+ superfamily ATPase
MYLSSHHEPSNATYRRRCMSIPAAGVRKFRSGAGNPLLHEQAHWVGDLELFIRFVRLCAGRSGQLLNLTSLANDCGIAHTTARRWLSILEAGFLVALLRPHHSNFGKRLIKSPKVHFLDTGMLCYLLRIRTPDDLRFHALRGAIFEDYVLSELFKNFLNQGMEADVHFGQDSSGHEINILLEQGNKIVPIEVKSSQTITRDYFKGIELWRKLVKNDEYPAALVYTGGKTFRRKNVTIYRRSPL